MSTKPKKYPLKQALSKSAKSFNGQKLFLLTIVIMLSIYPVLLIISDMALSLDGVSTVVQDISTSYKLPTPLLILLHIMRFYIMSCNSIQICSTFLFVVLSFISLLLMGKNIFMIFIKEAVSLKNLNFQTSRKIEYLLHTHTSLQLAVKKFALFQELGTLSLMLLGLVIFVCANFVTLRFFGLLPFSVFFFFPSLAGLVAIIVNLTLPFTHEIYENSMEFGRILRASLDRDVKYYKRKIGSVWALRLYAGVNGNNVFCLNRETKVQYFENVINYTVNLLLI